MNDLEFQLTDELRAAEKREAATRAAILALKEARAMPESNGWRVSYRREQAIEAACDALEGIL